MKYDKSINEVKFLGLLSLNSQTRPPQKNTISDQKLRDFYAGILTEKECEDVFEYLDNHPDVAEQWIQYGKENEKRIAQKKQKKPLKQPFNIFLINVDSDLLSNGMFLILKNINPSFNISISNNNDHATSKIENEHHSIDLVVICSNNRVDNYYISTIHSKFRLPIIVISNFIDKDTVLNTLEAGATGYIPAQSSNSEIISMLKKLMSGEVVIPKELCPSPELMRYILECAKPGQVLNITSIQLIILQLICKGYDNDQIASELGRSAYTIKSHIRMIYTVLNVENRTECIKKAVEYGYIETSVFTK